MPAPHEFELKFALPSESLARLKDMSPILGLKARPRRTTEVPVYFDTGKQKLRKNRAMLRVRRIGDRYIQTIKATGHSGPFDSAVGQPTWTPAKGGLRMERTG